MILPTNPPINNVKAKDPVGSKNANQISSHYFNFNAKYMKLGTTNSSKALKYHTFLKYANV